MGIIADILHEQAVNIPVTLTDSQRQQFEKYAELLVEWNNRMNLTAIVEPKEIAVKHFIDCLMILKALPRDGKVRIIDVGTGAGFPGLPVKIACPQAEVTLVDSLQKRIQFLDAVIATLNLDHASTFHARAEEVGQNSKFREQYDYAVSRAVAPLNVLVELCLPLVRVGGFFIALKGPGAKEEIAQAEGAISSLGGAYYDTMAFPLPGAGDERSLVIIEKLRPTIGKYPRRPGMPEKRPL